MEWFETFREQLPVLRWCVYLNTGTAGPIPTSTDSVMAEELEYELTRGRGNFASFDRVFEAREKVRTLLGSLLHASPDDVALTHHTSDGINIVLNSIDWKSGDEVVTTSLEHDAGVVPLGLLSKKYRVPLRIAEIGLGEKALSGIAEVVSNKTRLVLLSHISYSSGALLEVKAICEEAHRHGALVLVDGAQSAGVLPIDVEALGADFYTVSGQKWLCGPEGTGALYVAKEQSERLVPAYSSYFSAEHHDFRGNVDLYEGARRFETGMFHRPSMAGFAASLEWMVNEVRIDRAWERSLTLARYCRERLEAIGGVLLVTPKALESPLVCFDLPAFSPAQMVAASLFMGEQGIVCRSVHHAPFGLRASLGFFNTPAEVDRFIEAVEERIAAGPESLPLTGWALKAPNER